MNEFKIFKNNGYHTESIGKVYHVGHGNTNDSESCPATLCSSDAVKLNVYKG